MGNKLCGFQNNFYYYMGDAEGIKTWRQFWGENVGL